MESRVILQMDQTTSAHQEVPWHIRECREGTDLDRNIGLRARGHRQEAPQPGRLAPHCATDLVRHPVRKNPLRQGLYSASSTASKPARLITN